MGKIVVFHFRLAQKSQCVVIEKSVALQMIKTCFIFILALDYLENLEVSSNVSDNKFDDNVKSAYIYI